MATTYKILGQSVPTTTTNGTLYTVPNTSTQTVVSSITVCNTSNAGADAYLYVVKGGGTAGTANAIIYDVTLDAFSTTTLTLGITLSNTSSVVDSIVCGSGTASSLTFQAFGSETA
jgi:hypothetical protein